MTDDETQPDVIILPPPFPPGMGAIPGFNFWVFPTEEGSPPRAFVFKIEPQSEADESGAVALDVTREFASWSNDAGVWMVDDVPLPRELSEAITEHAKGLGVEWPSQ